MVFSSISNWFLNSARDKESPSWGRSSDRGDLQVLRLSSIAFKMFASSSSELLVVSLFSLRLCGLLSCVMRLEARKLIEMQKEHAI